MSIYFVSPYVITSNRVTLSAFVHNPIFPALLKVESSTSNSCLSL